MTTTSRSSFTVPGAKPVVMVSLEDWASMDETTYLLASPANRAALMRGIAELDAGHGIVKTMAEHEAMAEY